VRCLGPGVCRLVGSHRFSINFSRLEKGVATTNKQQKSEEVPERPTVTLPGTVEKIIPAVPHVRPEKAQIVVEGAEDLYKEIRVDNELQDENGKTVGLKQGAEVEITIEAEKEATVPKEAQKPKKTTSSH
jgi:hypothetical protein